MGELRVSKFTDNKDKANYIHQLVKDIKALDIMIRDGLIEKSPIRIGAEQEFCLVDNQFLPSGNSLEILDDINDSHFTTEIGNYNLEVNLKPVELKGTCFSELHTRLQTLMTKAKKQSKKKNTNILLTGILPTLTLDYMSFKNMTQLPRYKILNDAVVESRKQEFDIHIKGIDELNLLHDSVILEGCNTSFQMHLQVNPDHFLEMYNWAQAISGPLLSACINSPILFGKELWSETRIALFTQSVDTRTNSFLLDEKQSRVSFGNQWETGNVSNIFKDNVSRFRSLVTSKYIKDSVEMLQKGNIPKLLALSLHNGTVYRWNRVCYGVSNDKPHLRIENRYIPAGPTITDEIANLVFWIGVMMGKPKKYDKIHEKMDFKDVKSNFFNAARYGRATQFYWLGGYLSSYELVVDVFLPMAKKGLQKYGISQHDIDYYLGIIKKRMESNNGSEWIIKQYRQLLKTKKPFEALQILTSCIFNNQQQDNPVCNWKIEEKPADAITPKHITVRHKMSQHTFTVDENDSVELVFNIMAWKNIHHVPVINNSKKLIGLLTWRDIERHKNDTKILKSSVKSIMIQRKDIITITQNKPLEKAKEIMKTHKIHGIPVIEKSNLIGIITQKDIQY